ncbi:hypothetical protein GJV85_07160 [Sulfurimonas aquatica]|uniref:Uncharacterized protein n=1 Tax=Sulfurimonas aquatica TaxID=2672570 RepID=A0A975B0B6_9BACT|nr:hypothetical protein [Sulfurimonas aquatica]QSZ41891.1 hypothetical protein GJV85_07160 [Sulfurimonas aquatica]
MKENHKITKYPSRNIQTETYDDGDTFVTKHFYDAKDAYVRELIYLKDGIKKVKHTTPQGVMSKIEHFVDDKRQGEEIKYFISKANATVKSSKMYDNGKLHGENLTYNAFGQIIKHEVFAKGKLAVKYLRENADNKDITGVQIIDKESVENLSQEDYDKLQTYI